jgi:hypothetical protein
MMRLASLVLVVALAFSGTAKASDPIPLEDIPPGDDVIVPLVKGKPAPFTGQLFEPGTAMRWGNWLQQYKLRLRIDVEREKSLCTAETQYLEDLRAIEAERNERIEKDLKERLLRVEKRNAELAIEMSNPSFWKSLEFGLILGVAVTAGGAIAIAVAAN